VVERLREKILSGELQEGEQLRQEAIAAEFEISRIPVREALSHLAGEGLVKIVGNRGAVVAALSPDEIMQLFETRAVLEKYMCSKRFRILRMEICVRRKKSWPVTRNLWNMTQR